MFAKGTVCEGGSIDAKSSVGNVTGLFVVVLTGVQTMFLNGSSSGGSGAFRLCAICLGNVSWSLLEVENDCEFTDIQYF
jgi:hypothetical protein